MDGKLKESKLLKMTEIVNIRIAKSDKVSGINSLYCSFVYNADIVSIFRTFPNRWYHPDSKEWELSYHYLDSLLDKLTSHNYEYQIIDPEEEEVSADNFNDEFKFKTEPFKHQLDAISFGLTHDKWLLGDTMGLGKSKVAIDLACIKKERDNYKHCLIICGINGLKWNWLNEIKTHSNEAAYILGQQIKDGTIRIGSTADKLNDILNLDSIDSYFIVTNIETLRSEECVTALKRQCDNQIINMIVLDEAHVCKNPTSQQGKGMLKLSAKTMIAMTGTPLMNNPVDLYFILKWLGIEKHSFYQFKNHYCVMGGYGGYEIIGYKNLNEIKGHLDDIMLRRVKEEVFDLPDKIYVDEIVEMLPKQKQVYDEVSQLIRMNIDKIAEAPNPLSELIRMRQATGYTGILSTTVQESAKLDRLEELVDEAISNNQKVVIFSNWVQMVEVIEKRLNKKYRLGIITGQTPDSERQEIVNTFQTDDELKVVIGTIGAVGTGITLTAATIEIFIDEPWNKASKEQAVDRCHRIGTTNNVTIYTLLCKDTIDERIHDLVERKGLMADMLVDGKIIGNRKELLQYLI